MNTYSQRVFTKTNYEKEFYNPELEHEALREHSKVVDKIVRQQEDWATKQAFEHLSTKDSLILFLSFRSAAMLNWCVKKLQGKIELVYGPMADSLGEFGPRLRYGRFNGKQVYYHRTHAKGETKIPR